MTDTNVQSDLSDFDFTSPRYYVKRHYHTMERREFWIVVDSTVEDGVHTMKDGDGLDYHIFRPAAIQSAHYTSEQARAAVKEANAGHWGISVEDMDRELQRRLYADIAEITGLSIEEISRRADALESEAS